MLRQGLQPHRSRTPSHKRRGKHRRAKRADSTTTLCSSRRGGNRDETRFFLSDVNWKAVDASAKAEGFSDDDVLLLTSHHANPVGEIEAFIHRLWDNGCKAPVWCA